MYGELLAAAKNEAEKSDEILRDHRCQAEVDLRPIVEVVMHDKILSPGVVVHGTQGVIQVCPSHG
jgi:hypothetical protein